MRGVAHGATFAFRGIPYAAPPVGERRFRAPEDAQAWTAPREAHDFGACCPQLTDDELEGSEDCLTLNVWTPKTLSSKPRAVLVFVHGGGNIQGCSAQVRFGQHIYEGDQLAAGHDVVVVTLNYRLGALGFLAHPALGPHDGNWGLRDQIAALEWVKRNIAAFGGDSSRVLLFGESAGAEDTCAHVVSARSKGLFSRALMQSATCTAAPLAAAEKQGEQVAEKLGCSAGDVVACLRGKSVDQIVRSAPGATLFEKGVKWGPVIDGEVIAAPPLATIASGAHNHAPFVIGDNSEETLLWVKNKPLGELAYRLRMHGILGKQKGDSVLARYPVSAYPDAKAAFVAATTDAVFICPARSIARAMAKSQREPVFRYLFTHVPALRRHAASGAAHGIELLFVFHHLRLGGYQPTPGEETLSGAMMQAWTQLAKDGDPGWPRYDPVTDPYEKLDEAVTQAHGLHSELCDFWDSLGVVP